MARANKGAGKKRKKKIPMALCKGKKIYMFRIRNEKINKFQKEASIYPVVYPPFLSAGPQRRISQSGSSRLFPSREIISND